MQRFLMAALVFGCGLVGAQAASVDIGHKLYDANCASCHGPMDMLTRPAVLNARDDPTLIRDTINTYQRMEFLAFLSDDDLANIRQYIIMPNTTDSDRIFDWGQKTFPSLLQGTPASGSALGYYYRFYSASNFYVGTTGDASNGGQVVYYAPTFSSQVQSLDTILNLLPQVQAAGF